MKLTQKYTTITSYIEFSARFFYILTQQHDHVKDKKISVFICKKIVCQKNMYVCKKKKKNK